MFSTHTNFANRGKNSPAVIPIRTQAMKNPIPNCTPLNVPTKSTEQPLSNSDTNSPSSKPTHKRNIRSLCLNLNNKLDDKPHSAFQNSYDHHRGRAVYTNAARARVPQHLVGLKLKSERYGPVPARGGCLHPAREGSGPVPARVGCLRPAREGSGPVTARGGCLLQSAREGSVTYTNPPLPLREASDSKPKLVVTGVDQDDAEHDMKVDVDGWQIV